jgi:hypothetical protein
MIKPGSSRSRRARARRKRNLHVHQAERFHRECCTGGGYACQVVRTSGQDLPPRLCLACRKAFTDAQSARVHVQPAGENTTLCLVVGFCERCSATSDDVALRTLAEAHVRELRARR